MRSFVRIYAYLILVAVPLLTGFSLHAQADIHYNAAFSFVQRGEVDSAKKHVDLLMQDPLAQKDPESWYLHGFVYKEMYKKYENTSYTSAYRDQALASFRKSIGLDTVTARVKATRDNIRYLAGRYYNDAVTTLDTIHYATSVICYEQYRQAALLGDPGIDIRRKDVEFYLALASTYNTIYNIDKKKNKAFFDLTRDTYMKVLTFDPNNYTANYNLGLLYWNKGVDLMYDIDYDDSLGAVFDVQDHSVDLFKQSLPFAEKAYVMEPNREETLIVLSGIYYSLNEFDKSKAYQKMLEDLRSKPDGK
jgi:tetratricopeptide (TPR) repeat protein